MDTPRECICLDTPRECICLDTPRECTCQEYLEAFAMERVGYAECCISMGSMVLGLTKSFRYAEGL